MEITEATMDDVERSDLEAKVREALKQHQREGLNMIGSVDQLVHRLVRAVEEWSDEYMSERRSASEPTVTTSARARPGRPVTSMVVMTGVVGHRR